MAAPEHPVEDPNGGRHERPRSSLARRLTRLAAVVSATYLGVCILVYGFQSRLIYFPSRDLRSTPREIALEFEDVSLTGSDGVRIHAWFVPAPDRRRHVIFAHGNAGNLADRLATIKMLHDSGLNVLAFDYRGYGRSDGAPSEKGTYRDAQAAWEYVTRDRGVAPADVVLFGRSLGGAVMIDLAGRHEPGALVVESTFTSLADVGAVHYPLLPVRWLLSYRYDSKSKIGRITCPKLFLHGRDDSLIPLTMARDLFDAAAEPKAFIETPGDHNDSGVLYAPDYVARFGEFLRQTLRPGPPES